MMDFVPKQDKKAFQLHYNEELDLIRIEFFGTVKVKQLLDAYSALFKHEKFHTEQNGIIDFSKAVVDVDLNETEIFYHFASGFREQRGENYLLALVYGDEMTKMLLNFYKLFLVRTQIEVEVLDSVAASEQWIKTQGQLGQVKSIANKD